MTRTALAAPDDPDDQNPDPDRISSLRGTCPFESRPELYFKHVAAETFKTCCEHDRKLVTRFVAQVPKDRWQLDACYWLPDSDGSGGRLIATQIKRLPRDVPAKASWYARISPLRLAGIAVFIAGRKRVALGCEWRSHLCGETGSGLPADRQVREAAGFLRAAVCYRLQDAADFAWRPVDAVLTSRGLSNLFVLLATLSISALFIRQGGLNGLADNLGSVAVVWGAAFGLVHVGRQWRDVKPLKRKLRQNSG